MSVEESEPPLCLPRLALSRLPSATLPPGTIDTHFHLFRAGAPLTTPRNYTPQIATLADWIEFADALDIAKGVLVQPSVYGFDNSVLLEALVAFPERLRGIVVIDTETRETEIERLHGLGVRGIRVNTRNKGGLPLSSIRSLAAKIAPLGWSLQLQVNPAQLDETMNMVSGLDLPLIIDHLGFIPLATDGDASHVAALKRAMDTAGAYIKVTAPYRLTTDRNYKGFVDVVRALSVSHAERLLWGSDWPHTELWERMPDDADLIEIIRGAAPDATLAEKIFSKNAEALFFGQ